MKQEWKVKIFEWGSFALDGGAMFGSVPKPLWAKLIAPDEQNRIPLALRSLYLEKEGFKVLVDVGMGLDWDEKFKKIYALETSPLEQVLKSKLALAPKDITHIVLTHLHFDHCGFLSVKKGNTWESAFPNAEIFLIEENFKTASDPNSREAASYIPHLWQDPKKRGQLSLLNCQWLEHREILPGLHYRRVDGHTRGQGMIYVGENILFPADLCPTENHIKEAYVMGYDMNAALSVVEKKQIFSESETRKRRIVFEHSLKTTEMVLT
jgi:glyoxylase-like metal-dependent hydrolase (beta-lactamase superfamily II)